MNTRSYLALVVVVANGLLLLAPKASTSRSNQRFLENIRTYSYPEYTRVVLDLSGPIKIRERFLQQPSHVRLFFDLPRCTFSPRYPEAKKRELQIGAGNLKGIRLGFGTPGNLRVVFDFDRIGKYSRFYLTSPFRIVFDIYREEPLAARSSSSPTGDTPLLGVPPSIARQLGLGVRRIILDPGHGGKDPGALNRDLGMEEKAITLDVAKRLQAMLAEHSEFQVLLTRPSDAYISLEERTAIANSAKGDLFVSIHTNSSRKKQIRGIESYFLSITADPWAMDVAATENAMSSKSIAELRSILEQIVKDSNVSESRILTDTLQRNLVGNTRNKYPQVDDLGVKQAPFYVLVGAQMPATLVELSFISYRTEAERLATPEYRHTLAAGLYLGIIDFIQNLNRR